MKVPMYIRNLGPFYSPPETGSGTTANAAGSDAGATSTGSSTSGNVTSGTASEAMIKAAMASTSDAALPAGQAAAATGKAGDTSQAGGSGSAATGTATGAQPQATGQPDTTGTRTTETIDQRIQAVTKNTRAQVLQDLGLPATVDPREIAGDVRTALTILQDLRRDPRKVYAELGAELGLTGRDAAAAAAADEKFPAPDLVSPDGKLKTYSDASISKILEIQSAKVKREVMEQLKPALDFYEQEKEARGIQSVRAESRSNAQEALAAARKLTYFTKENEPEILNVLKAIDPNLRQRIGPVASLRMAYDQFLEDKIFPNMNTAAEERVRKQNALKAATSAGQAHPTDSGGEGKKPELKGVGDLARHMEKLAAAAQA